MEMEESLREEMSETIVNALMVTKLDKPFRSQFEVGQWTRHIKKLFGSVLTDKQYRELWNFGIDSIESDDNE